MRRVLSSSLLNKSPRIVTEIKSAITGEIGDNVKDNVMDNIDPVVKQMQSDKSQENKQQYRTEKIQLLHLPYQSYGQTSNYIRSCMYSPSVVNSPVYKDFLEHK